VVARASAARPRKLLLPRPTVASGRAASGLQFEVADLSIDPARAFIAGPGDDDFNPSMPKRLAKLRSIVAIMS